MAMAAVVPQSAHGYIRDLHAENISEAVLADRLNMLDRHCPDLVADYKTTLIASALGKIGGSKKSDAKTASCQKNGKKGGRPRRKVICNNCGTYAKINWICAMEKAGFEVRHLECKECGRKTLA